jgi:hypothetical protein
MMDEEQGEACIDDGKDAVVDIPRHESFASMPTLSAAATQQYFAAAGNQFNALTRFGSEGAGAVSIEDRARATEQRRIEYERVFRRDGILEIDANGRRLPGVADYFRAVEEIQAKALALGYGAQSKAVPITSVPGGYVGRFGGHDIYAATR